MRFPSCSVFSCVGLTTIAPLFLMGTQAQSLEWQILPNSPVAGRHDDIHFVDENYGWAINLSGEGHRTTDGGQTWEQKLQVDPYLRSVHFFDELVGLVGTIDESELLYRTTDGGDSWTLIDSAIPDPPKGICGMRGIGDIVIATGKFGFGTPRYLRSTDRGATWLSVDMSEHTRNLIDCHMVSQDSAFVVGGTPEPGEVHPVVLFTPDAGQTWEQRHVGTDAGDYCWKIFLVSPVVGYVSVQGATILKTTDGGQSWVEKPVSGGIDDIQSVGVVDEWTGWVDGFVGETMMTTDGGDTWQPTTLGEPGPNLNRFQMFSEALGYASGNRIYKYGGVSTSIHVANAPNRSKLGLRNYPEPFNPTTTIAYRLRNDGRVRVRIFDFEGRLVHTLLDGEQSAGANKVVWDGTTMAGRSAPSGVYFYRVDASGQAESRMMTLVK